MMQDGRCSHQYERNQGMILRQFGEWVRDKCISVTDRAMRLRNRGLTGAASSDTLIKN